MIWATGTIMLLFIYSNIVVIFAADTCIYGARSKDARYDRYLGSHRGKGKHAIQFLPQMVIGYQGGGF